MSDPAEYDDGEPVDLGAGGPLAPNPADSEPGDATPPGPPERLQAAALQYEPGSTAPTVVATGSGFVAEQIVKAAQEAGVPVRSDPALANALAALDLGTEVPQELYKSVAETLAWAYRLDRQLAGRGPA